VTGDPTIHPRVAERARRTRRIRRGVGAGTLAAFALAWGVVAQTGSMGTATAASTTTSGSTATAASPGDGSATTGDDPSSAAADQPSGVTTAQS
jgi:hypothetical protein